MITEKTSYAGKSFHNAVRMLDRVKPDWYKRLDPHTLDLCSQSACVLGQTFGHFDEGLRMLGYFDDDDTGPQTNLFRLVHECGGAFCDNAYRDHWMSAAVDRLMADIEHQYAPTKADEVVALA
jgi:hypothetical protein